MFPNIPRINIPWLTDAYKLCHWALYPPNTKRIHSYFESRGSNNLWTTLKIFGLQAILKTYLVGQVFTQDDIEEAREKTKSLFGFDYFNYKGWCDILQKYEGKLPVTIHAVPEGKIMPYHTALVTIENTHDTVPFLTNTLETLLVQLWNPISVCTYSYQIKELFRHYNTLCGEPNFPGLEYQLHDFGFRGASSIETAGISGMAHLVNFYGTDTNRAIDYAEHYYGASAPGRSVIANEHSTVTSWGQDKEKEAYEHYIKYIPDNAIASIVIDSYDTKNAVNNILGTELKSLILARSGKIVSRPDSGKNPSEVALMVLDDLYSKFGGTVNAAGFKILSPKVGIIYGDGMNYFSVKDTLQLFYENKYSTTNFVAGCGGKLLQVHDRDEYKFAFKCSAKLNEKDEWVEVFKNPVTDVGKRSMPGRFRTVEFNDGSIITFNTNAKAELNKAATLHQGFKTDLLEPVFLDGVLLRDYTFDEIRGF